MFAAALVPLALFFATSAAGQDKEARDARPKIEIHCTDKACEEIAKVAREIASDPSRIRAGKHVYGDFGTYIGDAQEIDIGNDGEKVILGLWYKGVWNPWLTILRQSASGQYDLINPSEHWAGFAQIEGLGFDRPVLGHSFIRVSGKNYWVITSLRAKDARDLAIFIIERRNVRNVGLITVGNIPARRAAYRKSSG
jgi:hypothetical protein